MKNRVIHFTRGNGLFEQFLAKKRAEIANMLISKKVPKDKVLDIGCGSYPYFLTTTNFKKKYGIDYSVKTTFVNNPNIILKKTNVELSRLPFENNFFNAITMLAVFEHINRERLEFVLTEIKRVLKKDGIFIITTPSPWSDVLLHLMGKFNLISSVEIHDHKHHLSQKAIVSSLIEARFRHKNIKKGFFEVDFNMWFVAKK